MRLQTKWNKGYEICFDEEVTSEEIGKEHNEVGLPVNIKSMEEFKNKLCEHAHSFKTIIPEKNDPRYYAGQENYAAEIPKMLVTDLHAGTAGRIGVCLDCLKELNPFEFKT